jgi:hypothetical protein
VGSALEAGTQDSIPSERDDGDPVPIFTLKVSAKRIAYIDFSGPREGEYLAAEEVRFTPIENDR